LNTAITKYIEEAPEEQKQIMQQARAILHEAIPQVVEEYKWSRPVFNHHKDFAYFKSAKAHVTIGFYKYEKISDPDGLLEGTGKDMRHIKLKKREDLDKIPLADWFRAVAE